MANELVELIHDAERRNFITTDERSELVGKTIRQLTTAKSKFTVESDRFFATVKRSVDEKASALRANRLEYDAEGETGSDTKLRKFENRLENQRLNESKLDEMALEQHKQYDDVMTQVRKSIEAATEIVKSTLLNCGTDQIWLEDMLQKMNDDLRIFEEELNKEAGSPAIKSSQRNKIEQKRQREFLHSVVTNEVIGHVHRLQPFMSADERMCVAAAQVDLTSSAIRSVVREHVSNRLAYLARAFDKKQAATRAVKERGDSDEAEIRRELSEKLAVWTEEKAKPKHWSRGAVLRDADTRALSSVLRQNLEAFSQTCEVKRERRAGEVLLMTSLRILLSSKRIRSPECKVILQEHKSQCEKVEIDFAEEKLRREDDLRRKTQTQLLHKSAEKVPDRRTDMTCYRIGEITDRLIENTSERSDQEREALQNLLKLHNSVYAEKQKSLLEQEILLTRNLARLGDFKSHDVLASLRCLLPTKNDKYLEALSSAICPEPVVDDGKRKKKNIDIFKEDESKPLYLHIKQILLQEQAVETSHNSHLQHERYEDEMMDDYQQLSIRNNEPDSYPDMYSPYNSRPASSRDFRPASSSSRDPARPASSRVRGGKTRGHKKGMNLKRTTASR